MKSNWITNWNDISSLTTEQAQSLTTSQMQDMITNLFQQMLAVYNNGVAIVYNNPYGLTPQQVNDGFGANAVELTRLAGLLKDCINIAVPGTITDGPDPYNPMSVKK